MSSVDLAAARPRVRSVWRARRATKGLALRAVGGSAGLLGLVACSTSARRTGCDAEVEVDVDLRADVLADVGDDRELRPGRRVTRGERSILEVLGTEAEDQAPADVAVERRPRGGERRSDARRWAPKAATSAVAVALDRRLDQVHRRASR